MSSPARAAASVVRRRYAQLRARAARAVSGATRARSRSQHGEAPRIREAEHAASATPVDSFWGEATVPVLTMWTERGSRRQLEQRFHQYPLFREFSGLWGDHSGQTILDFGCGPGNDLVGFALYSTAERIIGLDVSEKALRLAAERLALHNIGPERVELIHAHDAEGRIPLDDESTDFAQSQGVIHHMSNPEVALAELHRVLRPGSEARIMVYNRDSVWRHLYVAHDLVLHDPDFAGLEIDEAFKRSTDGLDCPISRNYSGADFVAMCERAGFEAEYLGGYLSSVETTALELSRENAVAEPRLAAEHRDFLRSLEFDPEGRPMRDGKHAGIGGSYRLRRV